MIDQQVNFLSFLQVFLKLHFQEKTTKFYSLFRLNSLYEKGFSSSLLIILSTERLQKVKQVLPSLTRQVYHRLPS